MPSRGRITGRTVLAALLLVACSGRGHGAAIPLASYGGYDANGLASWYGEEAAGHRTASGDLFDPDGITAAHRSLPLGSLAEVTLVDTGRSVVVRINDRGPGRRDRIIDLSRGAARALGTDRLSIAAVRVRAVAPGSRVGAIGGSAAFAVPPAAGRVSAPASASGNYLIQIASFSSRDRAQALADLLAADVVPAGDLWRVRSAPIRGAAAAQEARDAMAARGYGDARIVPAD